MFFYAPRSLIDQAPGNDVTSLTMYTTHTRISGYKHINVYSLNPWESNHRDDHNNVPSGGCFSMTIITTFYSYSMTSLSHFRLTENGFVSFS